MIINILEKFNPLFVTHSIKISALFASICDVIMQINEFALPLIVKTIIIQTITRERAGEVIYRSEWSFTAVNFLFDFAINF